MSINNIFVINLERDIKKKERIIKRLKDAQAFNITTIFKAVDGDGINKDFLELNDIKIYDKWLDPNTKRPITKGEIGCSLSHLFVWREIVEKNLNNVIILEDDANFDSNLLENINKLNIPKDYDLLYLGRKNFDKSEIKVNDDILIPNFSYWTIGYILSNNGAKKLLESNFNKKIIPVDEVLPIMYNKSHRVEYNTNNFKAYGLVNNIVRPEDSAFTDSRTEKSDFYKSDFDSFLFVSVGTDPVDGYLRLKDSLDKFGYNYKILGFGDKWNGGNMAAGPGGGKKIIYLQDFLKTCKYKYILFSDCYDVIAMRPANEIWQKYRNHFNNKVVFSAEKFCWPNKSLEKVYPETNSNYKYLNSGGFFGPVKEILKIIDDPINATSDDQLYYTEKFLSNKYNIELDYECKIFQTLGGSSISQFNLNLNKSSFTNEYGHDPGLVHGNGGWKDKMLVNQIGNYFPYRWREIYGYMEKYNFSYNDTKILVTFVSREEVTEKQIQFLENCLNKNYTLFIFNKKCEKLSNWYNLQNKKIFYFHIDERKNRIKSLLYAKKMKMDYYFTFDNTQELELNVIDELLKKDKYCIGPLLKKTNDFWSNCWLEVDKNGFYKRSFDYFDIVANRRGVWNCAYICNCFLLKKDIFEDAIEGYRNQSFDIDMSICKYFRDKYIFMYVDNLKNYGKLI